MRCSGLVLIPAFFFSLGCSAPASSDSTAQESSALASSPCAQLLSKQHYVRVSDDVTLHVLEKYSVGSLAAFPRRAVLMLPPTLATNAIYDAQVPADPTYDAMERIAKDGYFVFTPSYEGYGLSTRPADGSTVTKWRILGDLGTLVEWIRRTHHVDQVDVFGMSLGASLAVALGGTQSSTDPSHIGRIVLASNVYKSVTPFFQSVFFTPQFLAFLQSAPNGYIDTTPGAYAPLLSNATPDATTWVAANLPGSYATGPTLEGFYLPPFDAQEGRAPALQFWGTADPVTPPEDVAAFQSEYGGPVQLHVIEGGAHALLFEAGRDELWQSALAFWDTGRPPLPTFCSVWSCDDDDGDL
ncbi:MAG TPA: alpha/beta fold hydrolase [Polyangiaceae bacterium]|nr:alpha/beta fold hydrolase [Polyangiaceae bacterium]